MAIDGFGPKLALVLKALTVSNGRLAADLAVDKSLVGRWIAGTVKPSAHNLTRLTQRLAASLPGFSLLDWDRTLPSLAAVLGGEAPSAVAPVSLNAGSAPPIEQADPSRPSIAVLPFNLVGIAGPYAVLADALPHDLIGDLSQLRWLFVIARGSSFRLRAADPDIAEVGRVLGVRYALTGVVEIRGDRIAVAVELADTRSAGIVWSDRYAGEAGAVHDIRTRITTSVTAALEIQIPRHEARSARGREPAHLDAWSSYHLGLQHIYRFTRADTQVAVGLFGDAVARDPGFARAHAGLSFAHFQNAFLDYTGDAAGETAAARRHAERALEIDSHDPFANLTMGRWFLLTGEIEESAGWLDRAIDLNPNYAQAVHARGWAQTLLCRGAAGQADVDAAMTLSPIDPLYYAMMSTRAVTHLVRDDIPAAAAWAERAAAARGSHAMIAAMAAVCHALDGDLDRARYWVGSARAKRAGITAADVVRAFPVADAAVRRRIASGLTAAGL